jgi:hypothetical protein
MARTAGKRRTKEGVVLTLTVDGEEAGPVERVRIFVDYEALDRKASD